VHTLEYIHNTHLKKVEHALSVHVLQLN